VRGERPAAPDRPQQEGANRVVHLFGLRRVIYEKEIKAETHRRNRDEYACRTCRWRAGRLRDETRFAPPADGLARLATPNNPRQPPTPAPAPPASPPHAAAPLPLSLRTPTSPSRAHLSASAFPWLIILILFSDGASEVFRVGLRRTHVLFACALAMLLN
jgi:hypothetical protein